MKHPQPGIFCQYHESGATHLNPCKCKTSCEIDDSVSQSHHDKAPESTDFTVTPLNPAEIVEYISSEHSPMSQMSIEEGKKHLTELIQRYADWYSMQKSIEGATVFIPE